MFIRRFSRIAFPLLAVTAGAMMLSSCQKHHCGWNHCGWNSSPEKRAEKITKHIAKELDLSTEQKAKLDKIKGEILAKKGEFSSLHFGLQQEFLSQLQSSAMDQDKLNRGFEERELKMKELRMFLIGELAQFHAMLDATQRAKLTSRLQEYCR